MRVVYVLGWVFLLAPMFSVAQVDSSERNDPFPDSKYRIDEDETESTRTLLHPLELETTKGYQREKVVRHNFDEAEWKKVVGDIDFTEVAKPKKEMKESKDSKLSIPWSGPLIRTLSYGFIIAVVLCLVWFIVKNVSFDMRIQRSKIDDNLESPLENIETLDIQAMLEQASREGNFKLAVRLYYLRLLKKLNELGMIAWKKDKTNRDYLAELFSRDFHFADIRRLTLFYESIWYGDHMLHGDTFETVQNQFETVHKQISNDTVS